MRRVTSPFIAFTLRNLIYVKTRVILANKSHKVTFRQ